MSDTMPTSSGKKIPMFFVFRDLAIINNIVVVLPEYDHHSVAASAAEVGSKRVPEQGAEMEELLTVGCNLECTDDRISCRHVQINVKPSTRQLFVTDLSSGHGIWVSGRRIEPGVRVEVGEQDTMVLGTSTTVYRLHCVTMSQAFGVQIPSASAAATVEERDAITATPQKEGAVVKARDSDAVGRVSSSRMDEGVAQKAFSWEVSYEQLSETEEEKEDKEDKKDSCPTRVGIKFHQKEDRKDRSNEHQSDVQASLDSSVPATDEDESGEGGNKEERESSELKLIYRSQELILFGKTNLLFREVHIGMQLKLIVKSHELSCSGIVSLKFKGKSREVQLDFELPLQDVIIQSLSLLGRASTGTSDCRRGRDNEQQSDVQASLDSSLPAIDEDAKKEEGNKEDSASSCEVEIILRSGEYSVSGRTARLFKGKSSEIQLGIQLELIWSKELKFSGGASILSKGKTRTLKLGFQLPLQPRSSAEPSVNSSSRRKKRWIMVVDAFSLLDNEARKSLQLLQELRGTQLIIPRMVKSELDSLKSTGRLFRRTTEATKVLKWIEECTSKAGWWIHVQETPPASPESSYPAMPSSRSEDQVLSSALLCKEHCHEGEQVVLISQDDNLKVKAMAKGLICETAEEFRGSLVNPFSKRFLWPESFHGRHTWSVQEHLVLREMVYQSPTRKLSMAEFPQGLKLIELYNSRIGSPSENAANNENVPANTENVPPGLKLGTVPTGMGAGLTNLGNSCFMNSILQCFTHTVPLVEALQAYNHSVERCHEDFCVLDALREHVEQSLASSGKSIAPEKLYNNLAYISRDFEEGEQEDAHEFLLCLLGKLDKCIAKVDPNFKSLEANDFVHNIFGGEYVSKVTCSKCGQHSDRYEPLLDLNLEIEKACNIEEALESFTQVEIIVKDVETKACAECNKIGAVEKQMMLHRAPLVAILQLKRFKSKAGRPTEKIEKHVRFPLELNLAPYFQPPQHVQHQYQLYAVVVHEGHTAKSGHYFCYIRSSPHKWHKFNDAKVTEVQEERVLSAKAYILLYAREDRSWFSAVPVLR